VYRSHARRGNHGAPDAEPEDLALADVYDWVARFRPSPVNGVSVAGQLWDYLGHSQKRVSRTNPPSRGVIRDATAAA
jgi:hypothetical protein